jgi:hypothetical protein
MLDRLRRGSLGMSRGWFFIGAPIYQTRRRGLLLPKVSEARKARIERLSPRRFPKNAVQADVVRFPTSVCVDSRTPCTEQLDA